MVCIHPFVSAYVSVELHNGLFGYFSHSYLNYVLLRIFKFAITCINFLGF